MSLDDFFSSPINPKFNWVDLNPKLPTPNHFRNVLLYFDWETGVFKFDKERKFEKKNRDQNYFNFVERESLKRII